MVNFATDAKLSLIVERGQKGSTPVDHKAGTILYLELHTLLGANSRCTWRDSNNATFAPFPYATSVLEVTLGFGARVKVRN